MAIIISRHAIEQYISRHAEGLSDTEAVAELHKGIDERLDKRKERTHNGDALWDIPSLGITVVVKPDGPTIVTVLPKRVNQGRRHGGLTDEEMEMAQEYLERQERTGPDPAKQRIKVSFMVDVTYVKHAEDISRNKLEQKMRNKIAEAVRFKSGKDKSYEIDKLDVTSIPPEDRAWIKH